MNIIFVVDDGTDKIDCYYEKEIMDKVAKNRESIDNLVIDKKDCLKDDETDDDAQKMATDKVTTYFQFIILHYILV